MDCKHCGNSLDTNAKFCKACGTPADQASTPAAATQHCRHCGAALKPGAKFCGSCGTQAGAVVEAVASTPSSVAAPITPPQETPPAKHADEAGDSGVKAAPLIETAQTSPAVATDTAPAGQARARSPALLIAAAVALASIAAFAWYVSKSRTEAVPPAISTDAASPVDTPVTSPPPATPPESSKPASTPNNNAVAAKPAPPAPRTEHSKPAPRNDLKPEVPAQPAPTPPASKTIDEQYASRSASECDRGLMGIACRESLKFKLCSGHWSDNPPPGQSTCAQYRHDNN